MREMLCEKSTRTRVGGRMRMRGRMCSVMIFALYVLVGLTRPLGDLHSDLSREARADLVEKLVLAKTQQNEFRPKTKTR